MAAPPDAVADRALDLLARERDPAALLSSLHDLARAAVPARVSVVLEPAADGRGYLVTSAAGLETSPLERWCTSSAASAMAVRVAGARRSITIAALAREVPELAERLRTVSALVTALGVESSGGLLVLGIDPPSAGDTGSAATVASAFTLALETSRQRRDADLERDLRQAMLTVSQRGELPVGGARVSAFCGNLARLLGADAAELWQHDRLARELVLAASSDGTPRGAHRVPAADEESPAVIGLAQDRPTFVREPDRDVSASPPTLSVPLRGRRRAIGTLVLRGVRLDPGTDADLLSRAEQAGRQLSALLESHQLLDDVLRSRRQLENVFDSLADLVVVCDLTGRVLEANRAFADRVGRPARALVGVPFQSLVGPELGTLPGEGAGGAAAFEVTDDRLGGTFVVSNSALAGSTSEPVGRVLVAREVTESRRLEVERGALETRLAQSEKLLALGQFVAGIAHELNNPLQGVLGHVELVRASKELPAGLKRDLALVHREAERAARIVRHLLIFAGSGRLRARRISLNALVTRTLRLRARAHRAAGIVVTRTLDPDLPRVSADGMLLQQALLNIVLNAEQAMAGPGTLTVRSLVDPGGEDVRLVVEDSGPGLTSDVRSRLFEPFYTTKEVGMGTGLGLAIAFGIVRAHGGAIEGDNSPEGGARFTVRLPVKPQTKVGAAAGR